MGGGGGGRAGYGMGGGGEGGTTFSCIYRKELSLDLKQSSDSSVTTSCGSPFQSGTVLGKNDMSVLCPAGWDVVAAGVVFSRAQSAAWWFWQVAGVEGDKTTVELVEHLQPSSPASFLERWPAEQGHQAWC